jgi:rhodanese-related sulfurtransferase
MKDAKMKNMSVLIAVVAAIFSLVIIVNISNNVYAGTSRVISPVEAKSIIAKGAGIIDVRTPEEYASGHIPGAKNINYHAEDFQAQLMKLDKRKSYVVYCRSGNRSGKAVIIMKKLGFSTLYDMQAFSGWVDNGFASEK